ncbi:MAG: hypothetical protein JWO62_1740 [Acidimicrobiaceae bacterium]|nr:hypothetical protein [Acidimicrobiaceae bacterium]
MSFELDRTEILREVRDAHERYERALVSQDLAVMAESFAEGPEVVRFGIADRQHGAEELARWRAAQPSPRSGRTLFGTTTTTYGNDIAVVTTMFSYPGRPFLGRQSQTWLRLDAGWRIVHAHVSEIAVPAQG